MEKINILKKICPVCYTDEFVTYTMGTHAEGRPTIVEGKEQYSQGDCQAYEHYECDKCGGEFSVHYEINKDKVLYMKINYKGERTDRNSVLTRA